MKNNKLFKMVVTAMLTAMIFVLTRFVCIPVAIGYIHLGDALAYLSASIIGPYGLFAVAVGEALADITIGWAAYAPATVLIKILIVLPFALYYRRKEKILSLFTVLFSIMSGIVMVLGYFLADMIINRAYAVVNITGNAIQAACSAVLFMVVSATFDSAELKKKFSFSEVKNG